MRFVNILRNWGVSSLLTFILYEAIWSVMSHTWPFFDEWLVPAVDLLYCSMFVLSSMVICGALSRIGVFRRIDFWSQTCLCLLTLAANLLLAFGFESVYNSVLGNEDKELIQSSLYVFCVVATLFTLVHHTSRFYRIILRQKDELVALQKKVLKSKLDPHFVFNSLSTLAELIHECPEAAEQYTIQFSRIYRHLLSTLDRQYVTVAESLQLVNDYVSMQKYRVDGDIEMNIELPESVMQKRLFPLSLQTLVENAIKHNPIRKGEKLLVSITHSDCEWIVVGNQKMTHSQPLSIGRGVITNTNGGFSENVVSIGMGQMMPSGLGEGLLRERYRLEHLPEPIVTETDTYYEIKIRMIDYKR